MTSAPGHADCAFCRQVCLLKWMLPEREIAHIAQPSAHRVHCLTVGISVIYAADKRSRSEPTLLGERAGQMHHGFVEYPGTLRQYFGSTFRSNGAMPLSA